MIRFAALASVAVAAVAAAAVPALADPIDDAITARRGYYQVLKSNFGPMVGMARGQIAYDAASAERFATNLALLSAVDTRHLWPEGSDNAARAGKTRALPAIWAAPGAATKAAEFRAAADALAISAGTGLDGLRGAIGAVGDACSACHKAYRAENF